MERYLRQHTRARNHQFETSLTRLEEVLCGCVISNSRVYGSSRWGDILGRRRRQSGRGGAKSCLVLEIVCFQQFSNNPAKGKFFAQNTRIFIHLSIYLWEPVKNTANRMNHQGSLETVCSCMVICNLPQWRGERVNLRIFKWTVGGKTLSLMKAVERNI